jgi:hypothetical protein
MPFGQADPRQYLEYLATVSSGVKEAGTEKIGDVETTKYHAVVQFDKALDRVPDATLDDLNIDKQDLAKELDAMHGLVGNEMPVDVWIDGDGLLRRMKMDMTVAGATMSIEMNLDQYGVDVHVEAPPADQVGTLDSLMDESSSGFGTAAPAA